MRIFSKNYYEKKRRGKKERFVMAFKETLEKLHQHLQDLSNDLQKVSKGNKAASQRVRTGTLKLEKIGKQYRKESLHLEKSGKFTKTKNKKSGFLHRVRQKIRGT